MGVLVAVEGFEYTLAGVTELAPRSAVIAPAPSAKTTISGKGVYRGSVTLTFASGTLSAPAFTASATNTVPAVFTIPPSKITKYRADGSIALGVGDVSGQIMVTGLATSGTSTVIVTVPATVSITGAGQAKVSAV